MPGMMDTILNLGLNETTCAALARETNNERFAMDSYRRFILMFTNIAKGHPRTDMDKMLDDLKASKGYKLDTEVTTEELKVLVAKYKDYYKKVFGEEFPTDPKVQLMEAVAAVLRSWDNPRANTYRQMYSIPYSWGTAVNVQSMAFGNKGETSGTGVAFSRNPGTGEKVISLVRYDYHADSFVNYPFPGGRTPRVYSLLVNESIFVAARALRNLSVLNLSMPPSALANTSMSSSLTTKKAR